MHKPESVLENVMYETLWEFWIQIDYQIQARSPDLVLMYKKKRTYHLVNLAVVTNHKVKIKAKRQTNTLIMPQSWKNSGTLMLR